MRLLRKTKKTYYSNLNIKDLVYYKRFWKTIKSFLSDKSNSFENISLIENGNRLTDNFEIAETFNKYFQNLVPKIIFSFILDYVHKSIILSAFPSILKLADIIPVYKKDSPYEKSNYRPISVLPNLSKIFENVLYD